MDDLAAIEDEIHRCMEDGGIFAATSLYGERLGGFRGIGWHLAEYRFGLRVTERLAQAGGVMLEGSSSVRPWYDRALYHLALGNLKAAEEQLKLLEADLDQEREEIAALDAAAKRENADDEWFERYENLTSKRPAMGAPGRLSTAAIDILYRPALYETLSDLMLAQGRLVEAERYAQRVIDAVPIIIRTNFAHAETGTSPYGRRAAARFQLGKVNEAWSDLEKAEGSLPEPRSIGGMQRTYRLRLLIRQGKLKTAEQLLGWTDQAAAREDCPLLWANYSLCQADVHLARSDAENARLLLDQVVEWAEQSGHQETWIRAMLGSARVGMQHGSAPDTRHMLEDVERVARDKGFALWLIECLILKGHWHVQTENFLKAEEAAQEALSLSGDSVTGYAWGAASGSHLMADIRFRQGWMEEARTFAQHACTLRMSLGDARLSNSQALLNKIAAG